MESNPLRGLFGKSSPGPVEQRVSPQLTKNENACFEIPLGMVEKLLANPFLGDGTKHRDEHLIYVDEVCGLFKLAGVHGDVVKKKVFPLSLKGDASTWYRLCDDTGDTLMLLRGTSRFMKEKVSLKLGGGLSKCYIHAPIMSSREK